jgi:hypothetical protein
VSPGHPVCTRRDGVTHDGYVDDGWKDTVLVMPGEKATILMRFLDYRGRTSTTATILSTRTRA